MDKLKQLKRLEEVEGKIVEVPTIATRYVCCYYTRYGEWITTGSFKGTEENALQEFLNYNYSDVEFYTILKVNLPIPPLIKNE